MIKSCKKKTKQLLDERTELKGELTAIQKSLGGNSKESRDQGRAKLNSTEVGRVHQEFYAKIDEEVQKISQFYAHLSKNLIKDLSAILQSRENWKYVGAHLVCPNYYVSFC